MWLNFCNAVGLVPGLDDKAALLRGLSRDADGDELPVGERSVREGEYAHRARFLHFSSVGVRVSCIFRPLGIGRRRKLWALCLLKFEPCRISRCTLTWESF